MSDEAGIAIKARLRDLSRLDVRGPHDVSAGGEVATQGRLELRGVKRQHVEAAVAREASRRGVYTAAAAGPVVGVVIA
jgi:hypothetical protein